MDIIIIVLLAIRAWRKGWKAKVFLPIGIGFGCCFLFGAMIGASGGSFEAALGFGVIMDLLIIITLIVMAVRSPKKAGADHVEERELTELRPANPSYCSLTTPSAQSGQVMKTSLLRNSMSNEIQQRNCFDFNKNQDKNKLDIHSADDICKTTSKDPKDAAIYNNRGVAYRRKGAYQKAIQYYTKAILIKPDYATAFNNRATALYFMQRFDQAWEDINCCRRVGGTPNPKLVQLLQNIKCRPLINKTIR